MQQPGTPSGAIIARDWSPSVTITLMMSYFVMFGISVAVQGVLGAELIQVLKFTNREFGTALLLSPLTSIILLLQSGPLTIRFGKRVPALIGAVLLCIAMIATANAWDLTTFALAQVVAGAGYGLVELSMNSTALDWERSTGRAVMNTLHAGFSGGAVLGALLAGGLLSLSATYVLPFLVVAVLYAITAIITVFVQFPPADERERSADLVASLRVLISSGGMVILAIMCLVGTIGESISMSWSVIHLRALGAPAFIGGVAFALFNLTMFVGRLANANVVARFGAQSSLLISAAAFTIAGALLVIPNSLPTAITGFALLGLAVAGVVPTVLSAAARLIPGQAGAVTGAIMSVAYFGFVVCPPLIGWLADSFSLQNALLTVVYSGLLMLALTRALWRRPV